MCVVLGDGNVYIHVYVWFFKECLFLVLKFGNFLKLVLKL